MYNSWVEVSKSAILHNLAQYQKIVGRSVEVMPIVKSNAYGHGMIEVARIVSRQVNWIGTVNLAEALVLRQFGINNKIFVLSYIQPELLKEGIRQNIDLPVYDLKTAKLISQVAKSLGRKANVQVKIDTGTSRLGININQAIDFIEQINALPNLKLRGVWSHFAASEENKNYTILQLKQFNEILFELVKKRIDIPYKHFACSAAALVDSRTHFNLIRLGLSLYGLWPSPLAKKSALKKYPWLKLIPALTWKTKVVQVKEIPRGTKVGYGCSYVAKKKIKIAILAVGYWEGYDRGLSNKGTVIINNISCPVIGRVCMNLTIVDVSRVDNVKFGDAAVLIGRMGPKSISAQDVAEKIDTINYEIVTRINPILPRIFVK